MTLLSTGQLRWDLISETYRVLLVGSGYVPDLSNHVYVSAITDELTGNGYVRKAITDRSITPNATGVDYVGASVRWSAIGPCSATPVAAVLFKANGTDATSPLIAYITVTPTPLRGGAFLIRWNREAGFGALLSLQRPA